MRDKPPKSSLPYLMLVITALLWSTGGFLVKGIQWHPVAIVGMRSLIAAAVILIAIRKPELTWSLPQLGGAVCYAGTVILYVIANKLTTAANAVLLMYTAPIYVIIFGPWFLKEKASRRDWLAVGAVMVGIVVFFMDKLSPEGFLGNMLAVLSGVSFAWMTLFLRKQKRGSPVESVFLGNLLAAVIGLPFFLREELPEINGILMLIALGTFQLGFSYVLYTKAIQKVRAFEAVLITMLEPVLNPVWVFLLLGEVPGNWALAGGTIVMATVVLHGLAASRK
ncbi:MAG TPA: EamA/RhaT family transporter [Candidatus Marinimicrobia bacterium]|nr:EamA/RhaT family transporter [Candidatus Neomarinimicrobiota bacterium]HIB95241.1 EamA/RhaT family transporter [Candidatus Neomarinimicrobiota bacterium]HIC74935.1 EamA/RhaT family transporter [Candidatus Neomarinimicrobiota bacterium]HIO37314.1 EamA/RhaT family transporter [Candidatus Neomarinimicrobiota bacterium]HIO74793.1 EamA/RhaT family transporter [Candidatus Neomarinimicrobiota bacterium]